MFSLKFHAIFHFCHFLFFLLSFVFLFLFQDITAKILRCSNNAELRDRAEKESNEEINKSLLIWPTRKYLSFSFPFSFDIWTMSGISSHFFSSIIFFLYHFLKVFSFILFFACCFQFISLSFSFFVDGILYLIYFVFFSRILLT